MKPTLSSRAVALVALLALGLLIPGLSSGLTQADTLPAACDLVDMAAEEAEVDDSLVMLSVIMAPDVDQAQVDEGPRPPRSVPAQPGSRGAPKPSGADLHPPDPALLAAGPVQAVREFRESLTEKQKSDLQAVFIRNRDSLLQARARLPELAASRQGNRPLPSDREAKLGQVSDELRQTGDQIDREIDAIVTPKQRALLQRANPRRLRGEAPVLHDSALAEADAGC